MLEVESGKAGKEVCTSFAPFYMLNMHLFVEKEEGNHFLLELLISSHFLFLEFTQYFLPQAMKFSALNSAMFKL